jgi:signal transduction histidine kinase
MVTDTNPHEEDLLEACHVFWQMWATRQHRDDLEKLLTYCDAGVTCIGTGTHEIFVGIDEYRQLIIDDLAETPGTVDLDFFWSRAKIFDRTGVVEAEMDLKVPVDGSLQSIGLLRLTQVYRKKEGRWMIVHFHLSFPSSDQTVDEVWPTEALKARNLELERQVAERTDALQQALLELKATQAQLIQQEKMASLGALTAGIAHEIKNPLNFVNNFSEIIVELSDELKDLLSPHLEASLQDEADDFRMILADLGQNAGVIVQHGKRADSIVHAMMQHASGGSGQREATDINQLVSEHIDLAYHGKRAQMPNLNVEINRDLDPAVGIVEVVPQEIGRVLLNLCGNAFDAVHEKMDTGTRGRPAGAGQALDAETGYTPTVTVSTRRTGEAVEIRVSDNGPGIPTALKEKIFEPFLPSVSRLRLVSRRSRRARGRGWG